MSKSDYKLKEKELLKIISKEKELIKKGVPGVEIHREEDI